MRRGRLLVVVLLLAPTAAAHVPRVAEADEVVEVGDGTKSWAFYETLAPDATHVYRFDLAPGDPLTVMLYTPATATQTPSVRVETPTQTFDLATDDEPRVFYEPFAPMALRELARLDTTATTSGEHRVIVAGDAGPYGLAIGLREEFTPIETIAVPIQVMRIREWDGQPIPLVLAPYVLIPLLLLVRTRRLDTLVPGLFLATSLERAAQTTRGILLADGAEPSAIAIGLMFLLIPVALAALTWRPGPIRHLLAAAIGLVAWAGLVIGPAIAIALATARAADRLAARHRHTHPPSRL